MTIVKIKSFGGNEERMTYVEGISCLSRLLAAEDYPSRLDIAARLEQGPIHTYFAEWRLEK